MLKNTVNEHVRAAEDPRAEIRDDYQSFCQDGSFQDTLTGTVGLVGLLLFLLSHPFSLRVTDSDPFWVQDQIIRYRSD